MVSNRSLAYRSSVVILLALLSGACSRSPEYFLKKGNQLAAQGKYAEAELNYRNATQKNPRFGEAFYQLGLTDMKAGKVIDGYRALGMAAQLMPDRDDVKVKLADLSFALFLGD